MHTNFAFRSWSRLAAAWAFALATLAAAGLHAASIHVSPTGSDSNNGTAAAPFATLERARAEVRAQKPLREPIDVVLHGGAYVQDKTLELEADDSGAPQFPVTWQAAADEEVRVAGGPVLGAERFVPVTDEQVLARLQPAARGKVLRLDLRDAGDPPIEPYPGDFRGVPAFPELFFNDQRMTVARWPNSGWATVAGFVETGSIPREGDTTGRPGVFAYSGQEPERWNIDAGVWLQGYWCYDWYDQTIRIKSLDRERKHITLAAPALYGVRQGNPSPRRFRAINLLEELDEPGEFYTDRTAKVLYFWPPAAIEGARISVSVLNAPLLRLKDARHLTIRGITFQDALGDGIEVIGGHGNRIERCVVRNIRQLGIRVKGGTQHHIDQCEITDTGTGGLVLEGGDRKTLTPAAHQATQNHIWNFSRHQLTAAYGLVLGGVGNRAANNHIHHAPHQAVLINGNDHVFELNKVDHVVTETDDAGALYKGRNPSSRGNIIRHNFFADIGAPLGHGTGAIYFDDGDGGDLVFGNVLLRCGYPGAGSFGTIFSHGGHDLRAENNIFIDCKRALGSAPWGDQLWRETIEGGHDCGWQTKLLEEVDITRPPYTARYPELVGFMSATPGQTRNNHAKNNVLVRCDDLSSGNWSVDTDQTWVTSEDPGFVDAERENFALKPDAAVFAQLPNFKPIPFNQIGRTPAAGAKRSAITIHPDNPKYFLFRNQPTFLLTATEHYGSVLNRPFDFIKYLDDLVDKRMTCTRTFLLFREIASDKNPASPCKPRAEDYIAPWPRSGPGQAMDGQPKFDLEQWNPEFFQRLHQFLAAASERGIVVELTLFSNSYSPEVWALNPLRAENNLQGIGKIDWPQYTSLKDQQVVAKQLAHARKIIQETAKYDNVYYEICNEPGGGAAGGPTPAEVDAWQAEIARVVREELAKAGREQIVFGSEAFSYSPVFTQGLDATFDGPLFDVVNVHPLPNTVLGGRPYQLGNFMSRELRLADLREFALAAWARGKPCVWDEDNAATMFRDDVGWTIHRKRAWVALLSGSHYDAIDFSLQIGQETGTPESAAKHRTWFRILSEFFASLDYLHASPSPTWIGRCPDHILPSTFSVEGTDYVAYLADTREVTDPSAGQELTGAVELALPAGQYRLRFFSPTTGTYSDEVAFEGGRTAAVTLPPFSHDLVIRATKAR